MIPYAIYDMTSGTGAKLLATVIVNSQAEAKQKINEAIGIAEDQMMVQVTIADWAKNPDKDGITWADKQPLMYQQNYRYSKKICSEVQKAYNDGQYICPVCVKPLHHDLRWSKGSHYGLHVGKDLILKLVKLTPKASVYTCEKCLLSYSTRTLDSIIDSVSQ